MAKFRKRPVVIEAIQWTGRNPLDVLCFLELDTGGPLQILQGDIQIETLEGVMLASVRDWIIKGVKGEFYPCKPDIFEATYDPEPDDA